MEAVPHQLIGIESLGTAWGLFRHYWVLVINVFATIVLLMYMQSLGYLADVAARTPASGDVSGLRTASPVLHAGAALVLLVLAAALGLYKPPGLTRYGWRKQQERRRALVPQR